MEKIKAECSKCARKMELLPQAAARRKCGYCGGPLVMDAAAVAHMDAAIEKAVAYETASKLWLNLDCPICGRRARLQGTAIGTEQKCVFCSCLFVVPAPNKPLIPGPPGCRLDAASADTAKKIAEATTEFERLFAPLGGWKTHGEAVTLALEALSRRYALGHAEPVELSRTAATLFNELVRRAQSKSQTPQDMPWMCAMPPDWSGDFVAYFICHAEKAELSSRPEGRQVVSIETGRHEKSHLAGGSNLTGKEEAAAIAVTFALDIAVMAVSDGEYGFERKGEDKEEVKYFIREFLQVDVIAASGGSNFTFSHVWATGEIKDLTDKQKDIIRIIRSGLHAKVLPFLCMKAVFGTWFGANAFKCLERDRLSAWLKTLDPRLSESPAVDGLAAQGKNC